MNLAVNILTTLSARIITLGIALVSSIVLARILGPEGRGLFALALLLPEMAQSFGLLGYEQANAVYAGLEPNRRRVLVWQSVALAGVIGGAIALLAISFFAFEWPGSQTLLRGPLWIFILPLTTVPARLAIEYWGAIVRGANHIFLLNSLEVGQRVISVLLILVLVGMLRMGVPGAVWADTITCVATFIATLALLGYIGALGAPALDRSILSRTTRFAVPAHCGSILTYLNYRVDQFIIAYLLPPEQLGLYVIAVGLAERIWIPTGAVATALLPHLTNTAKRDPALAATTSRHVMIWTGVVCLAVFGLADVIVTLMFSTAFAPATSPLRWLLPGIFTLSMGKVLVAEMLSREKIQFTVWLGIVAALMNIAGNLLLIPSMGISGSALASTLSYTFVSLIVVRYYLKETGLSWRILIPRATDLGVYATIYQQKAPQLFQKVLAYWSPSPR